MAKFKVGDTVVYTATEQAKQWTGHVAALLRYQGVPLTVKETIITARTRDAYCRCTAPNGEIWNYPACGLTAYGLRSKEDMEALYG